MAISSINFKAVKKASSETHNLRSRKRNESDKITETQYNNLSVDNRQMWDDGFCKVEAVEKYLLKEEHRKPNEKWATSTIRAKSEQISKLCKKISGRKLQKNAVPIKEAVLNLNENHTMEDLQKVKIALENQFSISIFQMYIHRDEGRYRSKEEIVRGFENELKELRKERPLRWLIEKDKIPAIDSERVETLAKEPVYNYHAHILADFQNKKTGKMLGLKRDDMSQMQTVVAETLGMQRGKEGSTAQRLESLEFKVYQEEERLKLIKKEQQ